MDLETALLGGGIVTTGLMSGLLYGWSVSVIPGTKRVPAGNYVDTMQHINRSIINPPFVVSRRRSSPPTTGDSTHDDDT